jgi:hypothetical protein
MTKDNRDQSRENLEKFFSQMGKTREDVSELLKLLGLGEGGASELYGDMIEAMREGFEEFIAELREIVSHETEKEKVGKTDTEVPCPSCKTGHLIKECLWPLHHEAHGFVSQLDEHELGDELGFDAFARMSLEIRYYCGNSACQIVFNGLPTVV